MHNFRLTVARPRTAFFRPAGWLLNVLCGLFIAMPNVCADVVSDDDVLPADNIFTGLNEGIPDAGNFIDVNRVVLNPITGAIEDYLPQITFEGIPDPVSIPVTNINSSVVVGQNSGGTLRINSGDKLRFMHLIIGGALGGPDMGPPPEDEPLPDGSGTVEITGPGSLYNNDFTIIPPGIPQELVDLGISAVPRADEPEAAEGFDVRVGASAFSNGTLSITSGGRAEIHDSFVVGDVPNSSGYVVVDGFASQIQTGGCEDCGDPSEADPKMTVIGRMGHGQLDILNAATVLSRAPVVESEQDDVFSAVIGGISYLQTISEEIPGNGGQGIVNVDGSGSRWLLQGGLQIGGFSNARDSINLSQDDFEGNDVTYGAGVGVGELVISNGGYVDISSIGNEQSQIDTKLAIGQAGKLSLDGGRLNIASAFDEQIGPNQMVQLINDGTIQINEINAPASGRIDTGMFQNRQLGRVIVRSDQKLTVISKADLSGDLPIESLEFMPFYSYGLIQVDGGEIEFDRGQDDPFGTNTPVSFQPFQNRALDVNDPTSIISRRVGEITAKSAVMRFQTGLDNQGIMRFTAGDNDVFGDVNNLAATIMGDPLGEFPEGIIVISGDDTTVVFHDILTNDGIIDIVPSALGFTAGEFINGPTGTLSLVLGGGDSGLQLSHVSAVDNIDLQGGTLRIDLHQSGSDPINPMAGDQYEIMSAGFGILGNFASFDFPMLGGTLEWFAQNDGTRYLLNVFDAALAVGGDLNGDGIVDETDVFIWQSNAGNMGGVGDINMDGIVNGLDLVIIQMQFGGPGMGSGSGAAFGAVPEPDSAGLVLISVSCLLIAPCRRRGC